MIERSDFLDRDFAATGSMESGRDDTISLNKRSRFTFPNVSVSLLSQSMHRPAVRRRETYAFTDHIKDFVLGADVEADFTRLALRC